MHSHSSVNERVFSGERQPGIQRALTYLTPRDFQEHFDICRSCPIYHFDAVGIELGNIKMNVRIDEHFVYFVIFGFFVVFLILIWRHLGHLQGSPPGSVVPPRRPKPPGSFPAILSHAVSWVRDWPPRSLFCQSISRDRNTARCRPGAGAAALRPGLPSSVKAVGLRNS